MKIDITAEPATPPEQGVKVHVRKGTNMIEINDDEEITVKLPWGLAGDMVVKLNDIWHGGIEPDKYAWDMELFSLREAIVSSIIDRIKKEDSE
jgi:hypothetical protein